MYNVWRTTVILIVTMYTEFVLYYTMLIVLNKFNSIQFNSMNHDRSYRRHWFYSIYHSRGRRGIRYSFGCFSSIKNILCRIETRTRDRIYCQTIRTVRDISRDDRARITTCSLRTPTYRLKENYSIDIAHGHQTNAD